MIIVIADDITGAAELGGIALRFGLKVLLSNEASSSPNVDVLILYTNTRSLRRDEAVSVMQELTNKVKALNPSLVYKKNRLCFARICVSRNGSTNESVGFTESLAGSR